MPGVCEPTTGAPAHEISIISGRFSGLPSCSGPSWMIQDSPPTRHRPNMWNCRNVKKSCMCAEKKKNKILLPCQQVSTKNQELRGWKRKERREYHRHARRDVSARLFSTGHEAPDDIDPTVQIKYECEERGFGSRTEPSGSSAVC